MTEDRFNSVVWFALLISLGVFLRVPLPGGHELNVSLYDFVVPSVYLWVCLRRDIAWPGIRDIQWPALIVAAVLVHAYFVAHPIDLTGSVRETTKLVVVAVEVWMLCQIFRAPSIEVPPFQVALAALFVALAFAVAEVYREGFVGGSYDALQTVHASVLCGITIVLSVHRYLNGTPQRGVTIICVIALLLAVFAMVAKIYLVVGVAVSTLLALSPNLRSTGNVASFLGIFVAMLAVTMIILIGSTYFRDYVPFSYMQGVLTSLGYRLTLWEGAWLAFLENFPYGLGAGQYGAYMKSQSSAILFTHNTFLGILVEFGALGVVFVLGLLYLVTRSLSPWPFPIGLVLFIFFILPMLFHDVLGLRINHLMIALGLTAAVRWRLTESREAVG